ncbi:MAG TPA: hypothetical protein VKP69_33345 [Isosphaeraceae bacterium]|nr:hypothetical protein [Isosphaeraceae bacterium]
MKRIRTAETSSREAIRKSNSRSKVLTTDSGAGSGLLNQDTMAFVSRLTR